MNAATARETGRAWMGLFGRRRKAYEIDKRLEAMSQQEALAFRLVRHLTLFCPDGDVRLFSSQAAVVSAAVITDDALYVTSHGPLTADEGSEGLREISFSTARYPFDDAGEVRLDVAYPIDGHVDGGYHERWAFQFGDSTLDVESWGMGDDRELPRRIAQKVGWPVEKRIE